MSEKRVNKVKDRHIREDKAVEEEGLRHTLLTVEGRRFLWLLLSKTQLFNNGFTGNALTTAFNSGQQYVGQELLDFICRTDPEAYLQMQSEAFRLANERAAEVAQAMKETEE